MSFNIDCSMYLGGILYLQRSVARKLQRKYKNELPEGNFFENIDLDDGDDGELLPLNPLLWCGSRSGRTYGEILLPILEKTTGVADLAFIWEGGEGTTGLVVRNGKVERKRVKLVLEDEP